MGYFGVNFCSRDFLGVLLEAPGIFLVFYFCPFWSSLSLEIWSTHLRDTMPRYDARYLSYKYMYSVLSIADAVFPLSLVTINTMSSSDMKRNTIHNKSCLLQQKNTFQKWNNLVQIYFICVNIINRTLNGHLAIKKIILFKCNIFKYSKRHFVSPWIHLISWSSLISITFLAHLILANQHSSRGLNLIHCFFFRITNHPIKFTWRNSSALTRIFSLNRDSISMKVKFTSGDLGEPIKHGTRIKRLLSCNNANVDVQETAMLFWYTTKSKLCVSHGSVTINNAHKETLHKLALDWKRCLRKYSVAREGDSHRKTTF